MLFWKIINERGKRDKPFRLVAEVMSSIW